MKGALVLVSLSAVLVIALGMQQVGVDPEPERVFTTHDELAVREELPGGRMVRGNTSYRRCENARGQAASQGEWTYYDLDGRRWTWKEGCWR